MLFKCVALSAMLFRKQQINFGNFSVRQIYLFISTQGNHKDHLFRSNMLLKRRSNEKCISVLALVTILFNRPKESWHFFVMKCLMIVAVQVYPY
jgi:hypothetical protein